MVPCWKTLLVDSYDGRIDRVYPIRCYHQAIAHMPVSLSLYSNARDEILRALQHRLSPTGSGIAGPHVAAAGAAALPIPLLILGSLAVLLLGIGAVGAVWRRLRPPSPG